MFQFAGFASHTYVFSVRYPLRGGFPHSDISGSKLHCQLPGAFRRLARPSSPVIAKASTTCTYSLDPITLSSLARSAGYRQLICATTCSPASSRCNHNRIAGRLLVGMPAIQPSSILLKSRQTVSPSEANTAIRSACF